VDLRARGAAGSAEDPDSPPDPWCRERYVPPAKGPLYVAVRYREDMCRPVRVQPSACGCDDVSCEYSRWRDGYEISVLTEAPCEQDEKKGAPVGVHPPGQGVEGKAPLATLESPCNPCPPCPEGPWVVLATVLVGDDGSITSIDNCECRRIVPSLSSYTLHCGTERLKLALKSPAVGKKGYAELPADSEATLTVLVEGAKPSSAPFQVDLGEGLELAPPKEGEVNPDWSAEEFLLKLQVRVSPQAEPGPRKLTVVSACGSIVVLEGKLKVVPKKP